MATVLADTIKRIRTYKRLIEMYGTEPNYESVIKREWDNIKQVYRSDEMHTVYEVEGLHSQKAIYESLKDLSFAMEDIMDDLIGVEITIRVKEMRGTDIGRLPILDE